MRKGLTEVFAVYVFFYFIITKQAHTLSLSHLTGDSNAWTKWRWQNIVIIVAVGPCARLGEGFYISPSVNFSVIFLQQLHLSIYVRREKCLEM
jgi:hypothetical protein